ncbi:twin-arginine translocation signal domain-containing protein [Ruegeria intermedia]
MSRERRPAMKPSRRDLLKSAAALAASPT